MRPNFKNIDIKNAGFAAHNAAEWAKANGIEADWKTPEHIQVKPVYTKEDLEGMEHLHYASGLPPYLRGPYSAMYAMHMPVSRPPKNRMLSIAGIWLPGRKVCRLLSTCRRTGDMMPTTNGLWVTSEKPVCPSARWRT